MLKSPAPNNPQPTPGALPAVRRLALRLLVLAAVLISLVQSYQDLSALTRQGLGLVAALSQGSALCPRQVSRAALLPVGALRKLVCARPHLPS